VVFKINENEMKKELKQKELRTLKDCFSLKGKNAVIMGGAGKMAESFSYTLLSAGCESLAISDINNLRIKEIIKKLDKEFKEKNIYGYNCDVSNENQISNFSNFLNKKVKNIDVLIYSAMSKPDLFYAPFPKYKFSVWDNILKVNLSGAFLATQKLLPLMRSTSSIIYISSIYAIVSPDFRIYENVKSNIYGGKYPLSSPAVYSASKAGLIGFSRYMAVYLAEKDIRVNALVPGGVYDNQDDNFYKEYIKRVPLKRMAVWSDYNGAILFLASDASRYMTGQILVVDGGLSTW